MHYTCLSFPLLSNLCNISHKVILSNCVIKKKVCFRYYIFQVLYFTLLCLDARVLHIPFLLLIALRPAPFAQASCTHSFGLNFRALCREVFSNYGCLGQMTLCALLQSLHFPRNTTYQLYFTFLDPPLDQNLHKNREMTHLFTNTYPALSKYLTHR